MNFEISFDRDASHKGSPFVWRIRSLTGIMRREWFVTEVQLLVGAKMVYDSKAEPPGRVVCEGALFIDQKGRAKIESAEVECGRDGL